MPLAPSAEPLALPPRVHGRVRPDVLLVAVPVLIYLVLGYARRWVSDDGLIVTRVVRQLLAGHGPVFNTGERAEASTSPLWMYVVAAVSWVTHLDPVWVAVHLGLLCAVAGYALAISACCRMARARGSGRLLPAGALVLLALPPFWDFATSGLETGLSFGWIGGCFWLLVRARLRPPDPSRDGRRDRTDAFLLGLGPLIRPEYAVVSGLFCLAWWVIVRPPPRHTARLAGLVVALPLAYEVFRAGYYGILVPLPAVAKEAGASNWGRGGTYLLDLVTPYRLWLGLLLVVLALAAGLTTRGRPPRTRSPLSPDAVLAAAPVVAAAILALFVLRVGGDFMHGRMLLPPLFLLLLPALVVPPSRVGAVAVGALALWTALCATSWRVAYRDRPLPAGPVSAAGISDERAFWRAVTRSEHPLDQQVFVAHSLGADVALTAAKPPVLLLPLPTIDSLTFVRVPGNDRLPWRTTLINLTLGTGGAAARLDQGALDPVGLAYPLAAHARPTGQGRPGHDKGLDTAHIVADLGRPGIAAPYEGPEVGSAAAAVLACPDVQDLLASVREPLTPSRFWDNLTGAWHRTSYRLPPPPQTETEVRC